MLLPFINIHSHTEEKQDEVSVRNFSPDDVFSEKPSPNTFYSCGIHPWFIRKDRIWLQEQMEKLTSAMKNNHCLAIGEAGLDKIADTDWAWQQEVFEKQMALAEEKQKPLIIHCVRAWSDLLQLRKSLSAKGLWILHGFNSSLQMAAQWIESGCMLSFGNSILRSHNKLQKVISEVQLKNVFLETDNADLDIKHVYEAVAKCKNISMDELKTTQYKNFEKVFGIAPVKTFS